MDLALRRGGMCRSSFATPANLNGAFQSSRSWPSACDVKLSDAEINAEWRVPETPVIWRLIEKFIS